MKILTSVAMRHDTSRSCANDAEHDLRES